MKKFLPFAMLSLLIVLIVTSCDLITSSIIVKDLSADDAKVEIRAANQEIISQKEAMLESRGMSSLSFLMKLLTGSELKSAFYSAPIYARKMSYTKALNYFRKNQLLKSANEDDDPDMNYGIFEYNFESGELDLVEESDDVFQITYPADDVALANKDNNAVLTISNLVFDEIKSIDEYNYETVESIPVNADVKLTIDGKKALTADYNAKYSADGLPTSMSAKMDSDDGYSFSMSFSGSGTTYSSKLEYKLGKEDIMGCDLDIEYATNMEDVETIEGYYMIAPLKFKGKINQGAINRYEGSDLVYMNSLIDMQVIQSEQNAKIGDVEYQMYYDADWDESYPVLAVVYADGTSEWLMDVMTVADFEL